MIKHKFTRYTDITNSSDNNYTKCAHICYVTDNFHSSFYGVQKESPPPPMQNRIFFPIPLTNIYIKRPSHYTQCAKLYFVCDCVCLSLKSRRPSTHATPHTRMRMVLRVVTKCSELIKCARRPHFGHGKRNRTISTAVSLAFLQKYNIIFKTFFCWRHTNYNI